jgi:adenine/guanine phosphoribosyltransferase-like PRPP-binding protein
VGTLVAAFGATVSAYAFLVELTFLKGRERLTDADVLALIRY